MMRNSSLGSVGNLNELRDSKESGLSVHARNALSPPNALGNPKTKQLHDYAAAG